MKQKLSNLEAYYLELQKDSEILRRRSFDNLGHAERINLEISEGFRKFLIRGAWTKLLIYCVLIIIPIGVVLGAIYLNNHR